MQVWLPQIAAEVPLPPGLLAAALGTIDPHRSIRVQRAYLVAFFELHLRHRPTRLFDGPSAAYPEVSFVPSGVRSVAPPN